MQVHHHSYYGQMFMWQSWPSAAGWTATDDEQLQLFKPRDRITWNRGEAACLAAIEHGTHDSEDK